MYAYCNLAFISSSLSKRSLKPQSPAPAREGPGSGGGRNGAELLPRGKFGRLAVWAQPSPVAAG